MLYTVSFAASTYFFALPKDHIQPNSTKLSVELIEFRWLFHGAMTTITFKELVSSVSGVSGWSSLRKTLLYPFWV